MLHWLLYWTGGTNGSGPVYLEWSGFIGNVSILGAAITVYKKHTCHVQGCWRFAKHPVGHYQVCSKHHPGTPKEITHTHVKLLYKSLTKNPDRLN